MSYFKESSKTLGMHKPGTEVKIVYKLIEGAPIQIVITNCHCTSAKYDEGTNSVVVNYKVPDIPQHLKMQGVKVLPITQSVEVVFSETTESVSFTLYIKE